MPTIELGLVKGPQGEQGIQGPQGEKGADGAMGQQGPAGIGAYQSAVEGGFSGTEAELNSALAAVPGHLADTANPHGVTAAQVGAAEKSLPNGGFVAGKDATSSGGSGVAIGNCAQDVGGNGVVIGPNATSDSIGSVVIGRDAYAGSEGGCAIGESASSKGRASIAIGVEAFARNNGVAIGNGSEVWTGFAGGNGAIASKDASGNNINAIQLGMGTNNTHKSFQVYDKQLLDTEGNIPLARMSAITPSAIGAASSSHTHTAADVGADTSGAAATVQDNLNTHTANTTAHVTVVERAAWDGKAAAADLTAHNDNRANPHGVTAAQVGAATSGHTHMAAEIGAAAASHTHTAADVGAVPTSRTVNGKALTGNITLTAADVGAPNKATDLEAIDGGNNTDFMTPYTTKILVDKTFLNPPIDTSTALTGNQTITAEDAIYDYLFEAGKTYNVTVVAAGGNGGSPSASNNGGSGPDPYYNKKSCTGGGGAGAGGILTNYVPTKSHLATILMSSTVTINDEYNSSLVFGKGENGFGFADEHMFGGKGNGGTASLHINKAAPMLSLFALYPGNDGSDGINNHAGYGGDVTVPLTKTNGGSGTTGSESLYRGGTGGEGVLGGAAPSGTGSGSNGSDGGYKVFTGGGGGGYGGGGGGATAYYSDAYYAYSHNVKSGGYGGKSIVKIECTS